jgi:hypothetical protein
VNKKIVIERKVHMNKRLTNIRVIVICALVVLISGVSLAPAAYANTVKAQAADYLETASTVPTLVFPKGDIPIKRIIYIWTAVDSATKYQVQVYRSTTLILNRTVMSSDCHSGTCSTTHATDLTNNTYKWRVRAYKGGAWKTYSAWEIFSVTVGGFNSQFNTDYNGWTALRGEWKITDSKYYTTTGVAEKVSSTKHSGDFSVLTYEARMKRQGCVGCANALLIRGDGVLFGNGWWNHEYTFDYNDSGNFSVWKDHAGTETALKAWTASTYILKHDWNILKVTASGSQLKFYINGHLVWQGSDPDYTHGLVGIGMYRAGSSTGDLLLVDWAKLTTSVADMGVEVIDDVQVELSGGNRNEGP